MRGRTTLFLHNVNRRRLDEPAANLDCDREIPRWAWWSQTESNRRHHACKAGALPTELWPLLRSRSPGELSSICRSRPSRRLVGPGRLELPTSRLSGVRSNQLSYGPMAARQPGRNPGSRSHFQSSPAECQALMEAKEERETKTAAPRMFIGAPIDRPRERRPGGTSLERR